MARGRLHHRLRGKDISSIISVHRREFVALAASAIAAPAFSSSGRSQGRIETVNLAGSGNKDHPRIRVWLPPGYDDNTGLYRSLYMLDGQYAFAGDSQEQNFAADRRVARLTANGTIRPTLIVAIDNLGEDRFLQYMPQSVYERADSDVRKSLEPEIARTGNRPLVSRQFIEFLSGQLRPWINGRYRADPNRLKTAIFGASMGGVMSGAIFVEAHKAFGRAACMSPNWPLYDKRMIDHPSLPGFWANYFASLGAPQGRRLWLDHGTRMMDAGMAPHQAAIADCLTKLGWQPGCNLQTRVYEAGHAFAESAVQMDEVLAWLLA